MVFSYSFGRFSEKYPQHLLFLNLLVWNIYLDQDHSVIYQAYLNAGKSLWRISLRKKHRVSWWIPLGCSTGEVLGDQTKWHMRSVFAATLSWQLQMRDFGHPKKTIFGRAQKKSVFLNLPICFSGNPPQKTVFFVKLGIIPGDFPGTPRIDELRGWNYKWFQLVRPVAEKRY